MYKRDQIMFDQQAESDEDLDDGGEEIMAIPSRRRRSEINAEEDEDEEAFEEDDFAAAPAKKARKDKVKADTSGKGRFGKPVVDSDDSDADGSGSGSGSGSDSGSESEEEGWGRQYYAMPSNRREKQDRNGDEYDEQREQDRELEEREVRRLQRKAREALSAEDYGLEDEVIVAKHAAAEVEEDKAEAAVPVPESSDPSVLLRHMETHDPVKLALAREWPLVVEKLEKTQRGMRKVELQQEGQLHKGLGWLHYRECHAEYIQSTWYTRVSTGADK